MPDQRQQAEEYLKEGVTHVAAAFNLTQCREWRRFDEDTRERAEELLRELTRLFHDNWPETPAVIPWNDPRARALRAELEQGSRWITAREDSRFVELMYQLTARASDGRFIGRRAQGKLSKRAP